MPKREPNGTNSMNVSTQVFNPLEAKNDTVRTYVCPYVCLYVCLYVCPYVCTFICPYIRPPKAKPARPLGQSARLQSQLAWPQS